jgi:hypothetical protein
MLTVFGVYILQVQVWIDTRDFGMYISYRAVKNGRNILTTILSTSVDLLVLCWQIVPLSRILVLLRRLDQRLFQSKLVAMIALAESDT